MDVGLNINAFYTANKPQANEAEQARKTAPEAKSQTPISPERERVVEAIKKIQEFVDETQRGLKFSIDEDTGRTVVKVIARQSGEVIRQLPSEEALELAKRLQDAGSLLFSKQV
ncbi:MAG TPA: flagellar protein FlaG [Pseudomonas sp.]|jgi:flagellar protein FlaG|uniref:flagellar protein FlaG n=1 Tax=Pseudomonas sp. TaxID=306 RepID=UPI002C64F9BD|nr:flagellar protein FlaG [Pseudomonas sp.]HTO18356.1 flagellar protein FlaG [Pseudomonas sp.]